MSQLKVVVLLGGLSREKEVSESSGKACAQAIRLLGHQVIEINPDQTLPMVLNDLKPDVCFNALHGLYGEDGKIQGLLEWMEIPYTHSGVLASALAMDKAASKQVYQHFGIPIAESVTAMPEDIMQAHLITPPYVYKPVCEGSSFGIGFVNAGDPPPRIPKEDKDIRYLVEKYIPGRELSVAVLDGQALTVTDIYANTDDGWYDYQAKYASGGSSHILPADIPKEIFDACIRYSELAHQALGCHTISRSDFRYNVEATNINDQLIILETNTHPGMTPTSLAPEQAQHLGISFEELVQRILKEATLGQ